MSISYSNSRTTRKVHGPGERKILENGGNATSGDQTQAETRKCTTAAAILRFLDACSNKRRKGGGWWTCRILVNAIISRPTQALAQWRMSWRVFGRCFWMRLQFLKKEPECVPLRIIKHLALSLRSDVPFGEKRLGIAPQVIEEIVEPLVH